MGFSPCHFSDAVKHYYYHYDGLGSAVAISDEAGNIIEKYEYSVYGDVRIVAKENGQTREVSIIDNPYYFTGRHLDAETGLYYYRARYYSPTLGRFIQTDPIGYQGGMNLYAYCSSNPVGLVDALGLCATSGTIADWVYYSYFGTEGSGYNLAGAAHVRSAYNATVSAFGPGITNAQRSWAQAYYNSPDHSTATSRALTELYEATRFKARSYNNPARTSTVMNRVGQIGRIGGNIAIVGGTAISAYNVATADDHWRALAQEGGGTLGAVGGASGGAWAGAKAGAFVGTWLLVPLAQSRISVWT